MRYRCLKPGHPAWKNYGGRGITVCDEWATTDGGFESFFAHIGPKPESGLTLERTDNDKGYEPGNVRWATRSRQARNTRKTSHVTALGKTQCLTAWSEETGFSVQIIKHRLNAGWSPDHAVSESPNPSRRKGMPRPPCKNDRYLTHDGETKRLVDWAKEYGIRRDTLAKRLDVRGYTVERALTTPVSLSSRLRDSGID
jgi:hypothetical protein